MIVDAEVFGFLDLAIVDDVGRSDDASVVRSEVTESNCTLEADERSGESEECVIVSTLIKKPSSISSRVEAIPRAT